MACLLCKKDKFKKVFSYAPERALLRCAGCGLLQTAPMPTESELADYYQRYDVMGEREPYYQMMWGGGALATPEGRAVRERYEWAKKRAAGLGRVLDVGSGPGLFLRLVKEGGGEPVGAELNGRAAERSAREIGAKVYSGGIDQVGENGFDAVTLWDLIEHVPDPAGLIGACRGRLKDGGWLFIETPDEAALLDRAVLALARLGIKGPAATFYGPHHLVLFRRATLRRLLETNGFKVEEIRGAETAPGRIYRGKGIKDKMARLGLRGLFLLARLVGRPNKMLIAARKK